MRQGITTTAKPGIADWALWLPPVTTGTVTTYGRGPCDRDPGDGEHWWWTEERPTTEAMRADDV